MDIEKQTQLRQTHKKEEEDCCNNCKLYTCIIICTLGVFYIVSLICLFVWVYYT